MSDGSITLLHTSDWHLGRALCGRKRHDEFRRFLEWLESTIQAESVDVLVVAGDIFDSGTPGNRSLEMYYSFLCRLAPTGCRHAVIIGGNHDSPSLLNAPADILRSLNIHVIGGVPDDPRDEVILIRDTSNAPVLLICAVPFLRDRDVRVAAPGESMDAKERNLADGIAAHYRRVVDAALEIRAGFDPDIPLIATGHLFTTGGKTREGDGVRELYVGNLGRVGAAAFPPEIDYLALGHLHLPQTVDGRETRRYSGSPLPLNFGESAITRQVLTVRIAPGKIHATPVPVPVFQRLETISGDSETIAGRIRELAAEHQSILAEIIYTGDRIAGDLQRDLDSWTEGTGIEILKIRNTRIIDRTLHPARRLESLDELSVNDVFQRCLDAHDIPMEQRESLTLAFREIVTEMEQRDDESGMPS